MFKNTESKYLEEKGRNTQWSKKEGSSKKQWRNGMWLKQHEDRIESTHLGPESGATRSSAHTGGSQLRLGLAALGHTIFLPESKTL